MRKEAGTGRIFSVPTGAPFARTFVDCLLAGEIVPAISSAAGELDIARATIFVPTRRAGRALANEFLRARGGRATLLPRIAPLGRVESFDPNEDEASPFASPDAPSEVSDFERRLALAALVRKWADQVGHAIVEVDDTGQLRTDAREPLLICASLASAWSLAGELASLIDEFIIDGVDWSRLEKINPEEFDPYWGITQKFLTIAGEMWPNYLTERGLVDRVALQSRLVDRQIDLMSRGGQLGPLIVAGSTGANPITARLLAAIAKRPDGAVVLPGVDFNLDEPSWSMLTEPGEFDAEPAATHPQSAIARLLARMGVGRRDVIELGASGTALRCGFLSEALRPSESTDMWNQLRQTGALDRLLGGLDGLAVAETADERGEALCIAIKLRECLETPGHTAALVTPDRDIARRARAQLARWRVDIADSAGESLGRTPSGVFARLLLDAAIGQRGVDLIAMLTHPLATFEFEPVEFDRAVRVLNLGVLRAVPDPISDVADWLGRARAAAAERDAHPNTRLIEDAEWLLAQTLLERVRARLSRPWGDDANATIGDWAIWHRDAFRECAGRAAVVEGSAELDAVFTQLIEHGAEDERIDHAEYAAFFDMVAGEVPVRLMEARGERLAILGLLEARLLDFDTVVLAGLDEGVWPPQPRSDPFLNRAMRARLNMSPQERRIGQTAHDLTQLMGTRDVLVVRTLKRNGAPTVPSRFIQRMAALAGPDYWSACLARGAQIVALSRIFDPVERGRIGPPMPKPAVSLRPTRLSVTRIETLRRDPYSIYAESILRLAPLKPIDVTLGARDFGTAVHEVVGQYTIARAAGGMGSGGIVQLLDIAQAVFKPFFGLAGFEQFQWPRLKRTLDAYFDWENQRSAIVSRRLLEQSGHSSLRLADGSAFDLTARADRIEQHLDGTIHILDFKSGLPPKNREIAAGFSPQLVLEAWMLADGAFPIAARAEQIKAAYIRLGGSNFLEETFVGDGQIPLEQMATEQFEGLITLLSQLRHQDTAFVSRPYPQFLSKYGPYDHLSRAREWSAGLDEGGDA